jgi:hypothetical protein
MQVKIPWPEIKTGVRFSQLEKEADRSHNGCAWGRAYVEL